jgi:hypothetical protein
MTHYSAAIINYLISLAAICFGLYFLIQKSKGRPAMKFMGLPVNTVIKIAFIGIGIFLALIILTLLK